MIIFLQPWHGYARLLAQCTAQANNDLGQGMIVRVLSGRVEWPSNGLEESAVQLRRVTR